jgi:outer membrane immunogenic protein
MHSPFAAIAFAACAFAAGSAYADGFSKPMKSAAPTETCCAGGWTALYVGLAAGYSNASTDVSHAATAGATSTFQRNDISSDDFTGTVTVGYDRQFGMGVVAGVFFDYTFGELSGSGTLTGPNGYNQSYTLKFDDVWSVGGRIGFAPSCCTMYYAVAGYTQGSAEFANRFNRTLDGYFVGGGVEQKLTAALALKFEYRYTSFDAEDYINSSTTLCTLSCSQRVTGETDIHAFRVGLTYRFGDRDEMVSYK